MRTSQDFIDRYRDALGSVDPKASDMAPEASRALALTELCFQFLAEWLPGEDVSAVPFLMLGYPSLLDGAADRADLRQALATLRHTCFPYGSFPAWLDACRRQGQLPETVRCFDIVDRRPVRRATASNQLAGLLAGHFREPLPWVERRLNVADPGEALVRVDRGQTLLSYRVPAVRPEDRRVPQHALAPRPPTRRSGSASTR